MMSTPSFNVLVDAWIPLDRGDRTEWVTYRDLLTGVKDAPGLRHPREDCEFFARMLLSALTQVLFGDLAPDKAALKERINTPLASKDFDSRVQAVKDDFDMLGERPFLQVPTAPRRSLVREGLRKLLLDAGNHDLFKPGAISDALGPATALLMLYGAHSFAPAGGSELIPGTKNRIGYSASLRGMSPATCLALLRQGLVA